MQARLYCSGIGAVLALGLGLCVPPCLRAATWKIETIDHDGPGRYTTMKADAQGNIHLAYVVDDERQTLKYAFWDHDLKRWFTMKISEVASFPSLILDSKQRPRISWADAGTTPGCKLHYGYWDGTMWKTQAIPLPAETVAYYTSIALDANNNPSISFYEYDGPRGTEFRVRMRVVSWDGQNWRVETVDGSNQSGKFNSLAEDRQGHLYLAYANVNAGTAGLRFGIWDGQSWKVEEADGRAQNNLNYVGQGAHLVLDKEGNPHVAYLNISQPSVKYAVRKNGVWTTEVVDTLTGTGYPDRNGLTLDSEDRPYISYFDAGAGRVKVAHKDGSRWITEVVDGGGAGFTSSIQVTGDTVWLSYTDEGGAGLKVASTPLADMLGEGRMLEKRTEKNRETDQRHP